MFVFDYEENKLFASKERIKKLYVSVCKNIMLFHLKTENFLPQNDENHAKIERLRRSTLSIISNFILHLIIDAIN